MVSLDGSKELNDINRVDRNGNSTFNRVIKKINLLKEYNIKFALRATLSTYDYCDYLKIIDFFKELNPSEIHISNLCLYDDEANHFCLNLDKLMDLQKNVIKNMRIIEKELINNITPFYIPFLNGIKKIHYGSRSMLSCGILRGTTAVSTSDLLYPCYRFVGMEGFEVGNVSEGLDDSKLKLFCGNLDDATKQCSNCFARYICARGCVRDIAKNDGKFISYPPKYCDLMKSLIEEYFVIYANLKDKRPDIFKKFDNLFN